MQALLVLDVVEVIFALGVPLHDADGFVARVRRLTDRARAAGVPVFHFRQLDPEGSPFAAGAPTREFRVAPAPGDRVIDKTEPDMFLGTALAEQLAGIDELVVCGFSTEGCIDTTVRSAWAKGFGVVLAAGAHTTTANAVLSGDQIIRHHDAVLARFAHVVPCDEIVFGEGAPHPPTPYDARRARVRDGLFRVARELFVTVEVGDMARARAFYASALGATSTFASPRWSSVAVAGVRLGLAHHDHHTATRTGITLVVGDLAGACRQIEAAGGRVLGAPGNAGGVTAVDSEGNTFQLRG